MGSANTLGIYSYSIDKMPWSTWYVWIVH